MFSLMFREIVNLIQREKTHQQTKQNNNNQTTTTTKYTPTAKATEAMLSFTIFVE